MPREAQLARKLRDGAVQCQVCEHYCTIQPGATGKCGVRINDRGALTSTVYGSAVALHLDPVEKKPLFHFLPAGEILSVGTYGCNFHCTFCQNWSISQQHQPDERDGFAGRSATPEMLVSSCRHYGATMIAYTYNEPTVFFEYTYDTAVLAHDNGIRNVYVSNGFMTQQALDTIEPYLDAINVDLKAFTEGFYQDLCQGRLEPVKRNIRHIARNTNIWIEVTTLLIPGINDSDEELQSLAAWLAEVNPEMPWHISAFHPDYQMRDRPRTSMDALARAYQIGRDTGLHYVYVGNAPDANRQSTHCPHCGELLIRRQWYVVQEQWKERGICQQCGHRIPGVWS
jgi:pyruvate formate lyase activating enzyme